MTRPASAAVIAGALLLAGCGGSAQAPAAGSDGASTASCPPKEGTAERITTFAQAPPMCIDPTADYTATLTTDAGEVTIDLDAAAAPTTVNTIVVLARSHFYDGLTFHRVIQGFMAQGGDPEGTGSGGPGYTIKDELPEAGAYRIGSVAMANAGPDTNGSQFFIVTGDAGTSLPPKYSLFGQVTSGMEVVRAIEADGSAGDGPPATVHRIETVTITES